MTPSPTPAEVAAAVQAVLKTLGTDGDRSNPAEVFAERLLLSRHVETLGEHAREIRLLPGTIISPLARDAIRRRGIEVRWVDQAGEVGGEWGVAVEDRSGVASALKRAILEGREPWNDLGDDHRTAARWVAQRPERAGVVLSSRPAVVTWNACLTSGLRAATVHDVPSIRGAVKTLGANLLVIDPTPQTIHQLRYLLATYRRHGVPRDPFTTVGEEAQRANRGSDRPVDALKGPPGPAERALRDRLALASRGAPGGVRPSR